MSVGVLTMLGALGMWPRYVPPFQTFGLRGEFSVEDVSEPPERNEAGQVQGRQRVRWRLTHATNTPTVHKTRARAFEAAADIARARGDSVADCARILAGVRW